MSDNLLIVVMMSHVYHGHEHTLWRDHIVRSSLYQRELCQNIISYTVCNFALNYVPEELLIMLQISENVRELDGTEST